MSVSERCMTTPCADACSARDMYIRARCASSIALGPIREGEPESVHVHSRSDGWCRRRASTRGGK